MKKPFALAAIAAAALVTLPASAALASTSSDSGYVTAAWRLPITSSQWHAAGEPTGSALDGIIWPQDLELFETTESKDLDALDDDLAGECGVFQIDVYRDGEETDELLESGVLENAGDDGAVIIAGGAGTAWKFVDGGDCQEPPTTTTTEPPTTTTTAPPTTTTTEPPAIGTSATLERTVIVVPVAVPTAPAFTG
jgi:hypothetical protein